MSRFRILSFDGGGIRGIVSATIVLRLESAHPGFLSSVDMFAGTSTGAILACGLAAGLSPEALVNLYATCGKKVFRKNRGHLFGLTGSKYVNSGLADMLSTVFGVKTLADLGKKVIVPTFCLSSADLPKRWKPKFYHNFGEDADRVRRVSEVVLQSCSAPTYFPAHDGCVDGGVVANNPSMAALCQALDRRHPEATSLDDISLLSIGTGESYHSIDDPDYNFGLLDISKIMDIVLGGTESVPDYQCVVLLGDRYERIDPYDPKDVQMDDYGKVGYLSYLASECDLQGTEKWLGRNW
jgi:uncharacterized protein